MIWLYTPAFVPGSLAEVNIPDLEDISDEEINWQVPRTFVKLHDPDYLEGIKKPTRTVLKRSMNDTIRTYVVYDRAVTRHFDFTLRFDHLTTNRMKALEQFILNSEGENIGYKSPRGNFSSCLLLNPDALITVDHPGVTWDANGEEIISEWGNVELQLRVIKGAIL